MISVSGNNIWWTCSITKHNHMCFNSLFIMPMNMSISFSSSRHYCQVLIRFRSRFPVCVSGMVCAAFCIIFMKIKLEWHSIIFCSIGALFGLIFGTAFTERFDNILKSKTWILKLLNFRTFNNLLRYHHFKLQTHTTHAKLKLKKRKVTQNSFFFRTGSGWNPFEASREKVNFCQRLVEFLRRSFSTQQVNKPLCKLDHI